MTRLPNTIAAVCRRVHRRAWPARSLSVALLAAVSFTTSCQPKPNAVPSTQALPTTLPTDHPPDQTPEPTAQQSPGRFNPFLPQNPQIKFTLWQITVPFGAVSRNEEFWKHVDEQALDLATYDLLYKNGLRAGTAPASEWQYLRQTLADQRAISQQSVYSGPDAQTLEIPIKADIDTETIFYFDPTNQLIGKTFDACDNFLTISFAPAPRKTDTTRISIYPLVRAKKTEIKYTAVNNQQQITFVHPERMYECNLKVDVPKDRFLLLSPSPEARGPNTLGHVFLTSEAQSGPTETLLLLLPTGFRQPTKPSPAPNLQP